MQTKSNTEYIAGLIDAEGHFRLRKHKNRKQLGADFKIEITSLKCIKFVSDCLDIKKIITQNRGKNRKTTYSITIGKTEGLEEFIKNIIPYLNEKYLQAKTILEYLRLNKENKKDNAEEFYNMFREIRYKNQDRDIFFSYAYFSGLIDGDGYISAIKQKTNKMFIRIGIQQCYYPTIKFLHDKFGGSFQRRESKKEEHRDTYVWNPRHKETKIIAEQCKYFMIEKKDKMEVIISLLSDKEKSEWFRYKRWQIAREDIE